MQKLWTRDFTIITIGTVVSMLGGSMTGFAISLLVLDFTGSTLLYALFIVAFNAPKIVVPLFAGTYLDRFSRKRMIYLLDFFSSALFIGMYFLLRFGTFNYGIFLALSALNGAIGGAYQVAYDSLYPNLIPPGNVRKAYSVSSMIYPLAAIMTPVAAYLYGKVGIAPIFLITAVCFFVAACFETQIRAPEGHLRARQEGGPASGIARFREDFREGLRYIRSEPGLLAITLYFTCNALFGGGVDTLILPYFKSVPGLGELRYTYVMAFAVLGRLIGGAIQYRFRYVPERKLNITLFVYCALAVLSGVMLFGPMPWMQLCQFAMGILGITSYNIRISGTQSYVPDDHRARFNGVFLMATTVGQVAGPLLAGVLGELFPLRAVVVCLSALHLLAVFVTIFRRRDAVRPIYNQDI